MVCYRCSDGLPFNYTPIHGQPLCSIQEQLSHVKHLVFGSVAYCQNGLKRFTPAQQNMLVNKNLKTYWATDSSVGAAISQYNLLDAPLFATYKQRNQYLLQHLNKFNTFLWCQLHMEGKEVILNKGSTIIHFENACLCPLLLLKSTEPRKQKELLLSTKSCCSSAVKNERS